MAIGRVNTGGGGSGGTLSVTGVAGDTVTAAKSGKTYSRTFNSSGIATFKGLATGTWAITMTDGSQSVTQNVTINADYTLTMAYFSALITTTWPEGSTCSCTDGTSTLYAPDTSGSYTFNVPNKGTWTVTATNGDKTASKSVTITADGQTENVTLTYTYLSVFKEGTGAVQTMTQSKQTNATVSIASAGITFSYSEEASSCIIAVTTNKINLSAYSTIHVEAKVTETLSGSWGTWKMLFGVFSQKTTSEDPPDVALAYVAAKANSTRTEYTVDVSNLTTSGYVGLYGAAKGTVYNIWLD